MDTLHIVFFGKANTSTTLSEEIKAVINTLNQFHNLIFLYSGDEAFDRFVFSIAKVPYTPDKTQNLCVTDVIDRADVVVIDFILNKTIHRAFQYAQQKKQTNYYITITKKPSAKAEGFLHFATQNISHPAQAGYFTRRSRISHGA